MIKEFKFFSRVATSGSLDFRVLDSKITREFTFTTRGGDCFGPYRVKIFSKLFSISEGTKDLSNNVFLLMLIGYSVTKTGSLPLTVRNKEFLPPCRFSNGCMEKETE
jgi:hypothetical protein